MSQYFLGVIDFGGTPRAFRDTYDVHERLMDHSWYGNPYVNWFCSQIYEAPTRVAWIGDFSKYAANPAPEELYDAAWSDSSKALQVNLDEEGEGFLYTRFLVNHDRKEYLDCTRYYEELFDATYGYIPHPLSILTAIGNGLGSGDYRGAGEELVGEWAWNTLSVEDAPPDGYSEVEYRFKEKDFTNEEV